MESSNNNSFEITETAKQLFEKHFLKGMKNKDIASFKRSFKTLYNEVIIPMNIELLSQNKNQDIHHVERKKDTIPMDVSNNCVAWVTRRITEYTDKGFLDNEGNYWKYFRPLQQKD